MVRAWCGSRAYHSFVNGDDCGWEEIWQQLLTIDCQLEDLHHETYQ